MAVFTVCSTLAHCPLACSMLLDLVCMAAPWAGATVDMGRMHVK